MADARDESFDLRGLERLRREMEATAARFSACLDPNRTSVGKDKTGAVRATVDGTGRVQAVSVEESWRDKVEPSGLGRAVVSAVQNGQLQQVAAWSSSVVGGSSAAASATTGSALLPDAGFPPLSREQRFGALGRAVSLLESLPERLASFDRHVAELSERTTESSSPNHRIKLVSEGGLLADVHFDETWLKTADPAEIGREVSGAFQNLYSRAPDAVTKALASDPTISEIRRIGRDPNALLNFLGLTSK